MNESAPNFCINRTLHVSRALKSVMVLMSLCHCRTSRCDGAFGVRGLGLARKVSSGQSRGLRSLFPDYSLANARQDEQTGDFDGKK